MLISILFQIFIERISLRLLLLKSSKSRTSDKRSVYVLKNKCWTTATNPLLVSVDIHWYMYDDCMDCDLYINKFFLIQNNTQYFKNHMVMGFSGVLWINVFFGFWIWICKQLFYHFKRNDEYICSPGMCYSLFYQVPSLVTPVRRTVSWPFSSYNHLQLR